MEKSFVGGREVGTPRDIAEDVSLLVRNPAASFERRHAGLAVLVGEGFWRRSAVVMIGRIFRSSTVSVVTFAFFFSTNALRIASSPNFSNTLGRLRSRRVTTLRLSSKKKLSGTSPLSMRSW